MSNPTSIVSSAPVCPLATDIDGNPVELPEGAAAWRVRRHTGGRPRIQLGADKQPMQLPLAYTLADLDDILPPGAYRLDLVSAQGDSVGVTKPITIGQLRHADASAADDDDDIISIQTSTAPAPAPMSDARFVLEANVRSTQLAFQHNQRTLELAMRTAETLRDGVRVLADAQADWIKSLASSRGFFRNAQPQLPPPVVKADGDDEDEEEDSEPPAVRAAEQDWVERFGPLVAIVAKEVVTTLATRFGSSNNPPSGAKSESKLRDLFDWQGASERANANRAAKATPELPKPKPNLADLLASLPPATLAKLMHVRGMLSADEQERAMQLIGCFAPADMPALVAQVDALPAEQLAEFLRAQIAKAAA